MGEGLEPSGRINDHLLSRQAISPIHASHHILLFGYSQVLIERIELSWEIPLIFETSASAYSAIPAYISDEREA